MSGSTDPYAGHSRREIRELRERESAATPAGAAPIVPPSAPPVPDDSAATAQLPVVPPESSGAEPPAPSDPDEKESRSKAWKPWLIVGIIFLVFCLVWLGVRALMVKSSLEQAQRLVAHVQEDTDSMRAALPLIGEHAGSAATVSWDPIWRAAELVPWAGDNLRGVRLAAQSIDVAVNDLALPALNEMESGSDAPVLTRVLPIVDEVEPRIVDLAAKIERVAESNALVGPVRPGVDMVNQVMQMAAPAIGVVPDLLGADEPRTYLLVFMNNAESVGLGGSAASQTLVTVDGGAFEIAAQGSSGDYLEGTPLENVDVPESAEALYGDFYGSYVNMSSARPHFPAMAEMVTEFWDRDVAPTLDNAASSRDIDGVISIDPIALGFILDATGPIHLATGDVMTSDNAVDLLLSDVYHRWNAYLEPEIVDGFFASVATEVFDKIASADFNLQAMLSSVTRGIDNGSIYFHSFHDEVQQHIDGEKVSGVLPTSNEVESTVGVFFRDESASKIDYYMKSNIDVNQTCSASGSEFVVDTTLHLDIAQGAADVLPDYVKSATWGSSQFRTAVYVYGVPGTTLESVQMDGREVRLVRDDVVDLDRPVAYFETYLQPGEIAKVTATFSGEGDFGPAALQSTPMVQPTTGLVNGCAQEE